MSLVNNETHSNSGDTTFMPHFSKLPEVFQFIPADMIGGVEVAAKSMRSGAHRNFIFRKLYLSAHRSHPLSAYDIYESSYNLNQPISYLRASFFLIARKPEVVIISLWRSIVVLLIVKMLRPSQRAILFIHNTRPANWLDALLHNIALYVVNEIWVDSTKTLTARCSHVLFKHVVTIPPVLHKHLPISSKSYGPQFVFWGRLAPQKGISRSIGIFKRILLCYPDAHYYIIGPDGGDAARLQLFVREQGLSGSVTFEGVKSIEQIKSFCAMSTFYLQTSFYEGMAISVVEAMQLGLIPVVTPVGEISNYCNDQFNSIIIEDDNCAVHAVLETLSSSSKMADLSMNAVRTWQHAKIYSELVSDAVTSFTDARS